MMSIKKKLNKKIKYIEKKIKMELVYNDQKI
jgi:hypothetical protein